MYIYIYTDINNKPSLIGPCPPGPDPEKRPFQEPKLEVPTIYKAYVRPI